jgi:prephenate dehydratase
VKIGIQGIKASFHDVAARKYFSGNEVTPIECATFKSLCNVLENKEADYCMMAIENSIAGSILTNYTLLETHGFKIIGEVFLRIQMNLMALPGQKMSDIRIVQSHPMALLQCQEFLTGNPDFIDMKIVESNDTADSAKHIANEKLMGQAAIASEMAARTYGLEILKAGIETNQQNYTRFLVISRQEQVNPKANKASVCFETSHGPGSLAKVLESFGKHEINLTKIQSVPILGRPYQYSFHVDLEWTDRDLYTQAIAEISSKVGRIVTFGEYVRGERPI